LTFTTAVVCDFGLARVTTQAISVDGAKFKDIGGFSPRYAAPEVLANMALMITTDPEMDKKSDVYSFAIIIWEMVTRHVPWEGLSREQIEVSVRSGSRPQFAPSLTTGEDPALTILTEMAQSCWQENPNFRPSFDQITSKIASLL